MFLDPGLKAAVTPLDRGFLKTTDEAINELVLAHKLGTKIPRVNCHSMSRAIALVIPELQLVDGYYMGSMIHSWLLTPDQAIIDALPVGIITTGSLLIPAAGRYMFPSMGIYNTNGKIASSLRDRIETEETLATAEYLAAIMREGLDCPF
jgi:hypothetical protein